nr:MAG TPA: hypothetical protein [Bacteriophage sp.]
MPLLYLFGHYCLFKSNTRDCNVKTIIMYIFDNVIPHKTGCL